MRNPGNELAISRAAELIKRTNHFYLFGPPGVGKTHLAVGILKKMVVVGKIARFKFVGIQDLLTDCRRASKGLDDENADDLIDKAIQFPGYLLLDDIGTEKVTDFVQEKLYRLVDGRYSSQTGMIITSNLNLAELSRRLGERIASRVGSGLVAEITGDDFRLKHHYESEPSIKTSEVEEPDYTAKTVN